jgi:protein-disulfide isomerase
MPSGKRARQQRQQAATTAAPPPVRSKGADGTRQRQASPRALAIAGGVVLAIAIVVVLGVVLIGGSGGSSGSGVISSSDMQGLPATGSQNSDVALPGAAEANNLFKGIKQNGLTLGDPNAPVEMEMFIDVQCPVCQNYETLNLPTVVNKYVKTGKVQLHLKPWAFLGPQSFTGRLGLIAAANQNKGFQYAKVLYDNQGQEESGWLSGKEMAAIAANVDGLNLSQWKDDTNSSGPPATAKAVDKLATQKKVQGTPTIFVGCKDGKLQNVTAPGNAPTLQETEQAINSAACG